MGRRKLPLACSKCGRTPEQDGVTILSNRYCKDCMSQYNLAYRQKQKAETGLSRSQVAQLQQSVQVLDPDDDELVGSEEII